MKYLKELSRFSTFTIADATKIIGKAPAAKKYIKSLVNSGYARRIKKDLYTCRDVALNEDCANRFQIASGINEDSYVSYHSAFEFYGFYNQEFSDVQVSSSKKFASFDYDGYTYACYPSHSDIQVDAMQGAKVTSIERTIVDSINMLGKVMDAEELVKCLDLVVLVDQAKLIEVLEIYDKEVLYRKVGYILSFYKDDLRLTDAFFELCLSKGVVANHGCLVRNSKNDLSYNAKWGLEAYPDLRKLASKGGDIDV